jgi:lipopolysaccharide export system ATP-binding protein
MHQKPVLEVQNLKKQYRKFPVLNGVSFHVNAGEIVGLLGHNGAGKSTSFHIAMGFLKPTSGKIFLFGEDVSSLPIHKRVQKGLSFLSQSPSLFLSLTVEENILCPLEILNFSKKERQEKIAKVLDDFHLAAHAKKKASELSGGEKRRLEIARALINNPKVILLDEPFANIDPITIGEMKTMISLLKARGISVLITDHNVREIFSIVDRSYILTSGSVLAEGTPGALLSNPIVRSSYLGDHF